MSQLVVSVVIVNFHTREEITQALDSFRKFARNISYEIIVVDNSPEDGAADFISKAYPEVKLIRNGENKGFAAANNQGFAIASGEFLLMFNPDAALVDRDSMPLMIDFMKKNERIAAVGPNLIYPDGSWQHSLRRFPTPVRMLFNLTLIDRFTKGLPYIGDYMLTREAHSYTYEVEQPMGACLLLSRTALDAVGPLDERFFVYFEEVDWLKRARDMGYSVYFIHEATVAHIANAASNKVWSDGQKYFNESLVKYFRKHYGVKGEAWIKCTLIAASPLRVASFVWQILRGRLPAGQTMRFIMGYYLFLARLTLNIDERSR